MLFPEAISDVCPFVSFTFIHSLVCGATVERTKVLDVWTDFYIVEIRHAEVRRDNCLATIPRYLQGRMNIL